uniref:FH2 domain-containing protein n=1 Tax=Emiliania huxleyi TaxID=2903 RepID=A0A7S3S237_EMIHU
MRPPAPLLPPPPPPPPPPPGGGPARPAGPQLRALHWKKVQPSGKGTLWSSLPKAPPIDEAALRELFTVKAAGGQKPTAAPAGGGAGGSAVKKEQQPALLDVKRSNQIQIALAKFKGRGILAAVLALDETVLKQDDIARLRECSPSAEEVEMLSPFGEDPRLKETVRWGPAESFLLDMAAVPRLSQRLACFLSKLTFEQRKKDAEAQVEAINKAVQCLRGSKTLPLLLALVLQVGNALNAGTPRGAAAGFTSEALGEVAEAKSADSTHRGVPLSPPQALGKLAETKSTVSDARPAQTSLLHYVARVAPAESSKQLRLELRDLEEAATLSSAGVAEELDGLCKELDALGSELSSPEYGGKGDGFVAALGSWRGAAAKKVEALRARVEGMLSGLQQLHAYWGEAYVASEAEALLSRVHSFAASFGKACRDNEREDHMRKKRAEAKAAAAKRAQAKGPSRPSQAGAAKPAARAQPAARSAMGNIQMSLKRGEFEDMKKLQSELQTKIQSRRTYTAGAHGGR